MGRAQIRNVQASSKRHRIVESRRLRTRLKRAVDLFLIFLAISVVSTGFALERWTGVAIALALILMTFVIYRVTESLKSALVRRMARRAIQRWQVEAAADPTGPNIDAWLIVGDGNVLIADAGRRAVLLNSDRVWQAFRMEEFRRVDVVFQRRIVGRAKTTLTASDELAGPPLLEVDVVDGDADRFAAIVRTRVGT